MPTVYQMHAWQKSSQGFLMDSQTFTQIMNLLTIYY